MGVYEANLRKENDEFKGWYEGYLTVTQGIIVFKNAEDESSGVFIAFVRLQLGALLTRVF